MNRERFCWLLWGVIFGMVTFWMGCSPAPKYRTEDQTKPSIRWRTEESTQEIQDVQIGEASYYGDDFHGKKTASGNVFNMYALTAAHPSYPFGTRVRVTHLANDRQVVVTINDRGPFVMNRIIDLSYGAAEKIGMIVEGIAIVKLEVLEWGAKQIPDKP